MQTSDQHSDRPNVSNERHSGRLARWKRHATAGISSGPHSCSGRTSVVRRRSCEHDKCGDAADAPACRRGSRGRNQGPRSPRRDVRDTSRVALLDASMGRRRRTIKRRHLEEGDSFLGEDPGSHREHAVLSKSSRQGHVANVNNCPDPCTAKGSSSDRWKNPQEVRPLDAGAESK